MPEGKLKKASENPIAAKIRRALGAGPDEPINIVTPQFERPEGKPPPGDPPQDTEAFKALASMGDEVLREMGLRAWGKEEDGAGEEIEGSPMLWLFPGEWYPYIPGGFEVVSISFKKKLFVPGETNGDIRCGMLAFGILQETGDQR